MQRTLAHRYPAFTPAPRTLRKPPARTRDFRARGTLRLVELRAEAVDAEHCPLCVGAIDRFDHGFFRVHGRCAGCHEAVEGQ